jgi:hypothetical protein
MSDHPLEPLVQSPIDRATTQSTAGISQSMATAVVGIVVYVLSLYKIYVPGEVVGFALILLNPIAHYAYVRFMKPLS